jgi:hypothetical protein
MGIPGLTSYMAAQRKDPTTWWAGEGGGLPGSGTMLVDGNALFHHLLDRPDLAGAAHGGPGMPFYAVFAAVAEAWVRGLRDRGAKVIVVIDGGRGWC